MKFSKLNVIRKRAFKKVFTEIKLVFIKQIVI